MTLRASGRASERGRGKNGCKHDTLLNAGRLFGVLEMDL